MTVRSRRRCFMNRPKDIKITYLRVLRNSKPPREDWWAAAELIAAGYATGAVRRDSTRPGNEVDALAHFAPTMAGRLYADQLEIELRQRRWGVRLLKVVTALGALALAIATETGKALATRWLGF